MRILLINPPFQRLKKIKKIFFPLGLGYIAASLNNNSFTCRIYNAETPKENLKEFITNTRLLSQHHKYLDAITDDGHAVWKEIRATLENFCPDIVGITVMTPLYASALKVSNIVKEYRKDCIVIWGGPHPTVDTQGSLLEESVDFVVRGEGEKTIVELCNTIRDGETKAFSSIDGLSYKDSGCVINNRARDLLANIDNLPLPKKDLLMYKSLYPSHAFGTLMTSRGCPFECGYCSAHHTWGRRVRYRSIENVIAEIRTVRGVYRTKDFFFLDDIFTINRPRIMELCSGILNAKLDIAWNCITRADFIDDGLLKIMKRAGCRNIDIGIESGSQKILDFINKKITISQLKEASRLFSRNHMNWGAFFMFGFPTETESDIEDTLNFIHKLRPVSIEFSIFTPYPGTDLFKIAKESFKVSNRINWSNFSHQSPENYFAEYISKERYDVCINKIAAFVDQYNNSLYALFRKTFNNFTFYLRHPMLFFKKILSLVLRYARLHALRTRS